MSNNDTNGSLSGEKWGGVTPVVLIGHHVTVVEMEVEGALRVAVATRRGGWAESRPLPAVVEGDHGDVGGVWGSEVSMEKKRGRRKKAKGLRRKWRKRKTDHLFQ